MAFFPPAIRLKRVDLPTFGLPTMATMGFMEQKNSEFSSREFSVIVF
jgi:hypothetical protein